MTRWKLLLPLLFVLAIGASYGLPQLLETPSNSGCIRPEDAVAQFFKAVDRGELTLFTAILERDDIVPTHVEFLYELGYRMPVTIVHANLRQAMAIPGQPEMEIRTISAELNFTGSIVETKAHVYPKPGNEGHNQP